MNLNASKIAILLAAAFMLFPLTVSHVNAAPGDLDPSFGSGGRVMFQTYSAGAFQAHSVAIQSDGKIVVAGSGFDGTDGGFGIARYNVDGSADTTFGSGGKVITIFPNGSAFASNVVIQSDGKIVAAGGNFYYYYGDDPPNYDFLLARYNTDGSLDSTFGTGGKVITTLSNPNSGANDIAIQPDGKIVAAGGAGSGLAADFLLVRYNIDGSLDNSYGLGGKVLATFNSNASAVAVAIQSDGKIVATGYSYSGTIASFALARYNTNGSLDNSFGTGGKVITSIGSIEDLATAVAIQSDGKIVAAGYSYNGITDNFALVRYNIDGSQDSTFGAGGKVVTIFSQGSNGFIRDIAIQSDGKIVAAGRSVKRNNDGTISGGFALVRYIVNGSLDSTFGTDGVVMNTFSNEAWWAFWEAATAIQTDGKIVVAGYIGPPSAMFRYQGRTESGLTVTRSDDRNAVCLPGDCSLREAVNASNARPDDTIAYATEYTINFASGVTRITLTDEIVINNAGALTINGPGANILTIDGGAGTNRIFYINQATVTIAGVTLTGGNGTGANVNGGGAIYADQGLLTLDGVHVTGNSTLFGGGGVDFSNGGHSSTGTPHRIINSTFSDNTAGSCGGISADAGLTIVNSTISGNTAISPSPLEGNGGGICKKYGSVIIVNSTISGNIASSKGGGFYNLAGNATLRNVTITNNTAQRGGGIFQIFYYTDDDVTLPATLNLGNTIVAGNISTTGIDPEIFNDGSISIVTSAGGNLVGKSPGNSSPGIIYQPTDIRDTNPLLGPLQNNGGATPTHALLAGSPAIDKGLNHLVSAIAPAFDQRGAGFARIRDGNGDNIPTVDIGAFEVQLGATGARPAPFDFDGDGKTDISIFRPGTGDWWYLKSKDGGNRAFQFGAGTDKIVPGDYTGDGKTDVAFYRPSTGEWFVLRSEDFSYYSFPLGNSTDIPVPADYDGDGKTDAAVYRPSNNTWYIQNSSGNPQYTYTTFGAAGDLPVPADYDGDGKADIAIFRPSVGQWWIQRSTLRNIVYTFGTSTDKCVPGDYTGDGKADVAFWRPTTGEWFILRSEDSSYYSFPFGNSTDTPSPGDYDGDGKFDAAVFRSSVSTWYIKNSGGIPDTTIRQFGVPSDLSVPNAYVR